MGLGKASLGLQGHQCLCVQSQARGAGKSSRTLSEPHRSAPQRCPGDWQPPHSQGRWGLRSLAHPKLSPVSRGWGDPAAGRTGGDGETEGLRRRRGSGDGDRTERDEGMRVQGGRRDEGCRQAVGAQERSREEAERRPGREDGGTGAARARTEGCGQGDGGHPALTSTSSP